MLMIIKLISFGIWLIIMMFLLIAARGRRKNRSKEVKLSLDDSETAEMLLRKHFFCLKKDQRIVIEIEAAASYRELYFMVSCTQRKNPSIYIKPQSDSAAI